MLHAPPTAEVSHLQRLVIHIQQRTSKKVQVISSPA